MGSLYSESLNQIFPNPHSEAPALNPGIKGQSLSAPPRIEIKSESSAKNYNLTRMPPIPTGQSRRVQIEEGSAVSERDNDIDWTRKRIASAELKPSVKHVKLEVMKSFVEVVSVIPARKTKTKLSNKKTPRSISQSKTMSGGVLGVSDVDTQPLKRPKVQAMSTEPANSSICKKA
ncbi:uncharacterized protein MELLADRAFT_69933 [Melampsora larici-populina 98AG31]|uniref:Uncharacterized protein n=1 Tax=Melampsora larici-populina (strain 98AG31 / pathotype 3-4-7) TaxID=747676 RepID=F4SCV0_MELLP|nr:uncharacterized protein MELLADRAFT_69933 [Melampsora larici-populina 98AG31]EGF97531.1 hypothetical protein MELLADRAFT_69933 [Melampsora larici-populina 98AG31]